MKSFSIVFGLILPPLPKTHTYKSFTNAWFLYFGIAHSWANNEVLLGIWLTQVSESPVPRDNLGIASLVSMTGNPFNVVCYMHKGPCISKSLPILTSIFYFVVVLQNIISSALISARSSFPCPVLYIERCCNVCCWFGLAITFALTVLCHHVFIICVLLEVYYRDIDCVTLSFTIITSSLSLALHCISLFRHITR